MTTPPDRFPASALRARLELLGDPGSGAEWRRDERDYVAELAVAAADIPELVAIAREWAERDDDDAPVDPAIFAPIHAWRTLGQLRAVEAVRPLLEIVDTLDASGDDWYLEEYPDVFAKIGPACIPALEAYLRDPSHAEFGRIAISGSLSKLAQRYPEHRTRVVAFLIAALQEDETPNIVASLISDLIDLRATEGALAIERAFAADRVDLFVTGNWNSVKKELGIPGTGLVPAKLASASRRLVFEDPGHRVFAADRGEWNERNRSAGVGPPAAEPKRYKARRKKSR